MTSGLEALHISWQALCAVSIGTSAAVLANTVYFVMIGKVNERSPEGHRISYVWWGTEVRKRFKQLYPQSRLSFLVDSCVVVMVLCFIALVRFWVFS